MMKRKVFEKKENTNYENENEKRAGEGGRRGGEGGHEDFGKEKEY